MAISAYKTEVWYRLNADEAKSLAKFIEKHKVQMACNQDMNLEFSTASGIGRNTWVKCLCGAEEDITDYGSW